VLDEADRLLDMGFRAQLDATMRRLPRQRRTGESHKTASVYVTTDEDTHSLGNSPQDSSARHKLMQWRRWHVQACVTQVCWSLRVADVPAACVC
jgi:hypothetical protein